MRFAGNRQEQISPVPLFQRGEKPSLLFFCLAHELLSDGVNLFEQHDFPFFEKGGQGGFAFSPQPHSCPRKAYA
jgi:hypothetical protein